MYSADKLPKLMAFRYRFHERPAYQRGIAKTDFYAYGPTKQRDTMNKSSDRVYLRVFCQAL